MKCNPKSRIEVLGVALAFAWLGGSCTSKRAIEKLKEEPPSPEATACYDCHGDLANKNDAPPPVIWRDVQQPGAHQSHLAATPAWHKSIECKQCHIVPTDVFAPGHIDTPLPAELTWGTLATADNAAPSYEFASGTCSNVYCHGSTLIPGGTNNAPSWLMTDGSQAACGTCHALPPGGDHPQSPACFACHGMVIDLARNFVDPSQHIDGEPDAITDFSCNSCHGQKGGDVKDPSTWAPPVDLAGNSDTTEPGVGVHQQHLANSTWHAKVRCEECHRVPASLNDSGHIDTEPPAELTWQGPIGTADGAVPSFDYGTLKCSGTYCHGATLPASTHYEPTWNSPTPFSCGTCHDLPPKGEHPQQFDCATCHGMVLDANRTFVAPELHVNGEVNVRSDCNTCHGFPPATGAHATHFAATDPMPNVYYGDLRAALDYQGATATVYQFGCGNCHPTDIAQHRDDTLDIELYTAGVPGTSLKSRNPASASFSVGKCSDVYCHSSGQEQPAFVTTPAWFGGAFSGAKCAACHKNPPQYTSGGAGTATANTHLVMAEDSVELGHFAGLPGPWHVAGPWPYAGEHGLGYVRKCTADPQCAGTPLTKCDTSVGYCTRSCGGDPDCTPYAMVCDLGRGRCVSSCQDPCTFTEPACDTGNNKCVAVPCPGGQPDCDTKAPGLTCEAGTCVKKCGGPGDCSLSQPICDGGSGNCVAPTCVTQNDCNPYFGLVCDGIRCVEKCNLPFCGFTEPACDNSDTCVAATCPGGQADCDKLASGLTCDAAVCVKKCTGPLDCQNTSQPVCDGVSGNCVAKACSGPTDCEPLGLVCNGVRCVQRCSGPSDLCDAAESWCEASGRKCTSRTCTSQTDCVSGSCTPGADCLMCSPVLGRCVSRAASPITCQACHYDTVDPTNTGPGGFYYLDTTGSYDLGSGQSYACANCHTGNVGDPQAGTGRARPAFHVDGKREIVFDPRETIPNTVSGLPLGDYRPARPYWITAVPNFVPPYTVPHSEASPNKGTWSLDLALGASSDGASYAGATKTCSNVPCHLKQSFGDTVSNFDPLVWGTTPIFPGGNCVDYCHQR